MTTFTAAAPAPGRRSPRAIAIGLAVWGMRILLSAQFVAGWLLKLTADASMVAMFADIDPGQSLRLLVGVCEIAGAVGLPIPPLTRLAASGLTLLMVGAVVTNVVVLQISPVLPWCTGSRPPC